MVDFASKLTMTDISIDCETLGVKYDAPVLSIGAIQFNRTTGRFGKEFYVEINMRSAVKGAERGIDPETIYWWINQNRSVAAGLFDDSDVARARKKVMSQALFDLCDFVRATPGALVWSNGPAQDVTWLEHAYDTQAIGLSPPWTLRNVRDLRTLRDIAALRGFDYHTIPFKGTQHNALDDAKHQAHVVIDCLAAIVGKTSTYEDPDEI